MPVERQRTLTVLFREGEVRASRVGAKNIASSSGCAMRRWIVVFWREGGGGGWFEAV